MKLIRPLILALAVVVVGIQIAEPAFARRKVVVHRGAHGRTRVVVRTGHPIRRAMPVAVVRAPRRVVVVPGAVFLAPVVWAAYARPLPAREMIVWEDSETLSKDEGWTDFTLNVEDRGLRLFVEIVGKAQINFAEVVFENGDVQVVDFKEKSHGPGIFELLDFKDGRTVDHVRMVARAKSDEAKLILRMEK